MMPRGGGAGGIGDGNHSNRTQEGGSDDDADADADDAKLVLLPRPIRRAASAPEARAWYAHGQHDQHLPKERRRSVTTDIASAIARLEFAFAQDMALIGRGDGSCGGGGGDGGGSSGSGGLCAGPIGRASSAPAGPIKRSWSTSSAPTMVVAAAAAAAAAADESMTMKVTRWDQSGGSDGGDADAGSNAFEGEDEDEDGGGSVDRDGDDDGDGNNIYQEEFYNGWQHAWKSHSKGGHVKVGRAKYSSKHAINARAERVSRRKWQAKSDRDETRTAKEYFAKIGQPGSAQLANAKRLLRKDLGMKPHVVPQTTHMSFTTANALSKGVPVDQQGATDLHTEFLAHSRRKAASQFGSGGPRGSYGSTKDVPVGVTPLKVGPNPLQAFLDRSKTVSVQPRFAWHGTDVALHGSIAEHGLLVPGGDGVTARWKGKPKIGVAHGQAHGKGIYVSKTPGLAEGFAHNARGGTRGRELLLCAVLDDASKVRREDRYTVGQSHHFAVEAESESIR